MNLTIRLFGAEMVHISTDRQLDDTKEPKDTPGGEFGFGRNELTAIENPEHRWETERPGWIK